MRRLLRIVLVLVALLVGVGVVLWTIGGRTRTTMARISIKALPKVVFSHLTDEALLLKWMDGVTEITPLTEDGHRVGARSKVVVEKDGRRMEMEIKVARSEPDKLLEIHVTSPMFVVSNTYKLTVEDGATKLTQFMAADYKNVARLFAPIAGSAVQDKLDGDFERLKQLIETGKVGR